MQSIIIDHNDPRSTAAAAIVAAGKLSKDIREKLPVLLGQRTCGGLGVIVDRMERDPFDSFVIGSIEGLLDQCEAAVHVGTVRSIEWVVARSFAGDDEFEPVEVTHMTPDAQEIAQIVGRLRNLLNLVSRTQALIAADRLIDRLR